MKTLYDIVNEQTATENVTAAAERSAANAAAFNAQNRTTGGVSLDRAGSAAYYKTMQGLDTLAHLAGQTLENTTGLDIVDDKAYQDRTGYRGQAVARASGLSPDSRIIQGSFLEELPANMAGVMTGGTAFETAAKGITSLANLAGKQAVSRLVKNATGPVSRLTREAGREIAETVPTVGLNEYSTITLDEKGGIDVQQGLSDWKSYLVSLGSEAFIGSIPSIGISRAVEGAKKYRIKSKVDKTFDDAEFARLNLDKDALAGINETIFKDKALLDSAVTDKGFLDIDTLIHDMSTRQFENKYGKKPTTVGQDSELFNEILTANKEKLGSIDALEQHPDVQGAFIDAKGNFLIKTDELGIVKGYEKVSKTYTQDGGIYTDSIVDVKNSQLGDMAKYSAYDGKPIVDPNGYQMDLIKEALDNIKETDGAVAHMSEFETVDISSNGKLQLNADKVKSYAKVTGKTPEQARVDIMRVVNESPVINALKSVELNEYANGHNISTSKYIDVNKNPLARIFISKGDAAETAVKFIDSLGDAENTTAKVVSTLTQLQEGGIKVSPNLKDNAFNIKVPNGKGSKAKNAILDALFVKEPMPNTTGDQVYFKLKNEVKDALDLAYAIEVAKSVDDQGYIKSNKISGKSIVNTVFSDNILQIKGSKQYPGAYLEGIKNKLAEEVDKALANTDLAKSRNIEKDIQGERPADVLEARDFIKEAVNNMADTQNARQNMMSDAFGEFTRDWSKGISEQPVTNIKDPYNITKLNPDTKESALKEASIKWQFTEDAVSLLNAVVEGRPFNIGNKTLDTVFMNKKVPHKTKLAVMSGAITKLDVTGDKTLSELISIYNKLPDHVRRNIDKSAEEILTEAKGLLNTYRSYPDGHYYGTVIDNQKRIRYDALTNPKSSKLAMMVLRPDNTRHTLFTKNADNTITAHTDVINDYKRAFMANLGEKVEYIKDSDLSTAWDKFVDDFNNPAKSKMLIDEGIISVYSVKHLNQFIEALKNQDPSYSINLITEIDGKTNGPANMKAELGIIDPKVGIGEPLVKGADQYEEFNEVFKDITGMEFSRADVKSVVTGDFYLADYLTSAGSLAEVILNKIRYSAVGGYTQNMAVIKKIAPKLYDKYIGIKNTTNIKKTIDSYTKLIDQYNNIKDYIDEIANGTITVDNYGNISDLRYMQADIFKKLKDQIDAFKKDMNNKYNTSDLDLYLAIERLASKEELSDGQVNSFINNYAQQIHGSVKEGIEKIMHPDLKKYRELHQRLMQHNNFMMAEIMTSRDFIHSAEDPTAKVTELMLASNPRMRPDADMVTDMVNWAKANQDKGLSIADVLEAMGKRGYLTDKVMSAPILSDILHNVNGYAGSIPFYSFKGFAGYDAVNRTNFGSITLQGVYLPIYNISYDAMMMAHMVNSSEKGFVNKFDAVASNPVDGKAIVKAGNEAELGILYNANPLHDMKESYGRLKIQKQQFRSNQKAAAIFMAQQRLMNSKGKALPADVEKLSQQILDNEFPKITRPEDTNALLRDIDNFAKEIDRKKSEFHADLKVEQYTNGASDVIADTPYVHKALKQETAPLRFDHDLELLKKVEKNNAPIGYLKDMAIKNGTALYDPITGIKYDPEADISNAKAAITDNGVIIIKDSEDVAINDINILETVYHEPGHAIISKSGESFDEIISAIEITATKEGLKLYDADGNLIGDTLNGQLTNDEYLVKVIGILKKNEVIMEQPGQIAHRFNKTDLYSELRTIEIAGQRVLTTNDLKRVLKAYDFSDMINVNMALTQLSNYETYLSGAVNASTAIRNMLNKTSYEGFTTTFKNHWTKRTKATEAIAKANSKIQEIPALELFDVSPQREALEKIVSLKNGLQNNLQMYTASATEDMYSMLLNAGEKDFTKKLGKMELAGMSVTLKELKESATLDEYKTNLHDRVTKLYDEFASDFEAAGISKSMINEEVERLAFGKINPIKENKNTIAMKLLKRAYTDVDKITEMSPRMIEYIEKYSAYIRMFDTTLSNGKKHKGKMGGYVANAFRMFNNNPKTKQIAIEAMTLNNRYASRDELFNGNIEINPGINGMKFMLVDEVPEGQQAVAHIKSKEGMKYVIEVNENTYHMFNQDTQIINPNLSAAELPFYQVGKKKQKAFITAQNIIAGSKSIDLDFVQMFKRNYYNKMKSESARQVFNTQYNMLKEQGFIITEAEKIALEKTNPDIAESFQLLSKDNPISQAAGKHYFNVKYKHYIEGTEGVDITRSMRTLFGDTQFAKTATNLAKLFFGGTQIFKQLILQTRASSYINSFMSSAMIYGLHANKPWNLRSDMLKARQLVKEYRSDIKKLVELEMEPDHDKAAIATLNKKIESSDIHYAFKHAISDTIRRDAGTTGTYGENEVFVLLKKTFGSEVANRLKPFAMDPSVKVVRDFGEFYDATEMYPKVALYLDALNSGAIPAGMKPRDYAVQKVLMAFPTYNNLNPFLNVVDSFSPFTKYMANFPKMFMYTLNQSPIRFMPTHLAYLTLPPMTFNLDDEYQQKLADEGFLKIGDYAWYYESAYPLSLPDKSFDDAAGALGSVANFDFLLTAPGSIIDFTPAFELKSK